MNSIFDRFISRKPFAERYGPWALVAGGSEGIGAAWADYLARQKLNVILLARREDKLLAKQKEIEQRFQVECLPLSLDLGDPDVLQKLVSGIGDREVGFVVYNAALASVAGFYDSTLENELRRLRVNCQAPLTFCWHFGLQMARRRRGGIVLMSSGVSLFGCPYFTHYSATKAYTNNLAEGLWYELGTHGVDVIACIGMLTDTPALAEEIAKARAKGDFYMTPDEVVEETIRYLGKKPSFIAGAPNRRTMGLAHRLLPRAVLVKNIAQHALKNYLQGKTVEVPPGDGRH